MRSCSARGHKAFCVRERRSASSNRRPLECGAGSKCRTYVARVECCFHLAESDSRLLALDK